MKRSSSSRKRKAVSGILAGLIFFAMVFSAGLTFILFSFTSYNNYDKAQADAIQTAQAKAAETLLLRSCDNSRSQLPAVSPYSPLTCNTSNVEVWVQNAGSASVTLKGMWIVDATTNSLTVQPTISPLTTPALPFALNPGSATVVDTGSALSSSNKYAITLLTNTGNQFTATYPPPPQPGSSPEITLSPNSGPAGTLVDVTGLYFQANSSMTISYDGTTMVTNPSSVTTDTLGDFTAKFTAPSPSSAGPHSVSASDGTHTASAVFTVTGPSITLTPVFGTVGSTVTANGMNFGSSLTVTLRYDGVVLTTNPSTITTTSGGTFSATFAVPASVNGPHTVSATDFGGNIASAVFTVSGPFITLSPSGGQYGVGVTITVSGTGFTPSASTASVTIRFDGVLKTTNPASIKTDLTGSFSGTFDIVASTPIGPHTVLATDSNGLSASAIYTVTASVITNLLPSISLSPISGFVGTTVTVTGTSFNNLSTITIRYDGVVQPTNPASITSSGSGTFSGTFVVPNSVVGPHTVSATDAGGKTASAVFTVTAPAITINPVLGPIATTVTVIGANFAGSSTITIRYDGTAQTTVPATITTTSGGTFSATFTVPGTSAPGPHTVTATDGGGNSATAIFTSIGPIITLNPISGTGGTQVAVTGANFAGNSAVTLTFDGITRTTVPATVTTSAAGDFSLSFSVPTTAAAGPHTVKGTDATGGVGSAVFTVNCAASSNCVAASAFGIGYISFDFNSFKYHTMTGHTCNSSTNPCPSYAGSSLPGGSLAYSIGDVGTTMLAFSVDLTNVDPNSRNIHLDPSNYLQVNSLCAAQNGCGSIGGASTLWQLGCVVNGVIQAYASCPASALTMTYGQKQTYYFVTQLDANPPQNSQFGSKSVPLTSVFMIFHGTLCPSVDGTGCGIVFSENIPFATILWDSATLAVAPTSGKLGTTVTVTGSGFTPNSKLIITYDGIQVTTATATGAGAFPAGVTFVVPTSSGGSHGVAALDGAGLGASTVFSVSPGPTLNLNPASGSHGADTVTTLSGSNYANSYGYSYCLSTTSTTLNCVGSISTFTSTGAGAIPIGVTLTVNQPTAGTYYVIVFDSVTSVIAVSATFTET